MIHIKKSEIADTRTCDFTKVSKRDLLAASGQHIDDVAQGLALFAGMLTKSAGWHDRDKLTNIDGFHADFLTGFKATGWWDNHRRINRHHLAQSDGVPHDVNLIDVIEYLTDCVMAGSARSNTIRPIHISKDLLEEAFQNTVELLKRNVSVS